MPIYEYRCSKCSKIMEILQKFDEPAPSQCENCGAEASLSKMISQAAFHLKGTGWYVTDFKNKSQQKHSESPSTSSQSEPKSESSSSSETKSAEPSKSESKSSDSNSAPASAKTT